MRILAVTNMFPTASRPASGVFVGEQVRGLRDAGVDVKVHHVDRETEGMRSYYCMLKPIREALQQFSPDLVHVMYGGVMADLVMRRIHRGPKVVTFHGSDLLGENLSGFVRKIVSHYGILCSRRAARLADGVVVVSKRLQQALPRGLAPQKVRIIPCGIDVQRFRPMGHQQTQQQLGWDPEVFHVLFPSRRNNTVKRPELAIQAVDTLVSTGVKARLHFLEGVPNDAVPIWMNASDVMLLTSAHEGSPTVIKEALGCGLPIVSVDVGDVAEQLESVSGSFMAEAEPAALAARLLDVKRNSNSRMAGQELPHLSLQNIAARLIEFYQELVATKTARAKPVGPGIEPQFQKL